MLKRKRTNTTDGRNVLFNCHSLNHGSEMVSKEIIIDRSDNLYYNELYNSHSTDYSIDITPRDYDLESKFGRKFDIIYLVNCPDDVYITADYKENEDDDDDYEDDDDNKMGEFNLNLFQNLDSIMNNDGVIITKIAETGINSLLNTYNTKHNTRYHFSGFNESDELSLSELNSINLKIKKYFEGEIIPIIREMMKDFLKNNDLGFVLLELKQNKKHIHENFSDRIDDSIDEFLVIKKVNKNNFKSTKRSSSLSDSFKQFVIDNKKSKTQKIKIKK